MPGQLPVVSLLHVLFLLVLWRLFKSMSEIAPEIRKMNVSAKCMQKISKCQFDGI